METADTRRTLLPISSPSFTFMSVPQARCATVIAILMAMATHASGQQLQFVAPQPHLMLPSSVDKLKGSTPTMMMLNDTEVFKGVELTAAQREALSKNLLGLKRQMFEHGIPKLDAAQMQIFVPAQRLPGRTVPWWTEGLTDDCTVPYHTEQEVKALQSLLMQHLLTKGQDTSEFVSRVPKDCRRKQMIYFLQVAARIVK